MNKKLQIVLTLTLAFVVMISFSSRYAKGEDVLLASVDYVDFKFNELNNKINQLSTSGTTPTSTTSPTDPNITARVDNVEKEVGAIETNLDNIQGKIDFLDQITLELSDSSVWQVIQVDAGVAIYATDTSEIVLRSGTAKAIGNKYDEGLSDVTSGVDIKDGTKLITNHLIIIPRGDGRGVIAITNCYIMYKGLWYMQ